VLLGALIGFLPTVEGNLRQSLNEWLLDGSFWSLRASLPPAIPIGAPIPPAVLLALRRSMMLRPSPEVVWRQATRDHALGPVAVRTGEKVVVAIVSATHERLEADQVDEGMVFGGWRGSVPAGTPVPTHACPGHDMAMGTLCGILTALLERPEALRPTGFPLSFRMEGDMPQPVAITARTGPRPASGLRVTTAVELRRPGEPSPVVQKRMRKAAQAGLRILVGGDSWHAFSSVPVRPTHSDLIEQLQALDPGIEVLENQARNGQFLRDFAGTPSTRGRVDQLCTKFVQLKALGRTPDAVFVSAGGNDVVNDTIKTYVRNIGGLGLTPKQITDMIKAGGELLDDKLRALMDGPDGVMRTQVRTVLDKLAARCTDAQGKPVPVFWQGYDFPVPDGRNWGLFSPSRPERPNSVLWRPLTELGFTSLADRAAIMKKVVDRYNDMLKALGQGPYLGQLMHVDLRGTLNGTLAGDAYQKDWDNELHPTPKGFKSLAAQVVTGHLAPRFPVLRPAAAAWTQSRARKRSP